MIDTALSSALFGLGESLPASAVVFAASYLIWVMAVLLLVALWRARTQYRAFALLAASGLLAYGANAVIGFFAHRERPFISHAVEPLIATAHLGGSFPSDHAAVAWALASAYALAPGTKNAWLFFVLAFAVSIGRVLAGVHFAGDAAAGAAVGLVAAFAARYAARTARRSTTFLR